ncbi:RNA polymerase sigma factor [Enhygromyxa salina]|uniref:RNA polymerase sigma factor n=1 Tax=Enhygromyxa salina TaxID=215803 RepID=A0A2S9YFA3_9BACT|nr:sigma-70 family RNA polymerase sigma factor [Enhygromyxa salina]PRQ03797.1 RNA polymerase sigma factor YlaC [Enhygromyxa salina]
MSDDLALMDAWKRGDTSAGKDLFERHFDCVFRFLSRKIDHGAEDLVQQTFVKAIESAARFRGDCGMRSYLLAIARNLLIDHFRARAGDRFNPEVDSLVDVGVSPSTWIARQQDNKVLLATLRQLPLSAQTILELYYWEGLAGEEIAVVLGISPHTVRSRLVRARAKLRTLLGEFEDKVVDSTATELSEWAARLAALRAASAPNSSEDLDAEPNV